MSNAVKSERKEIFYISLLQIIGPIFVILGHSINGIREITLENAEGFRLGWYIFSKQWIYLFHMPLFFMISGYLLSFGGFMKNRSYGEFVKTKFLRLIVPYLFWNLLFYIPKLYLQAFTPDSVSADPLSILMAFITPRLNIWGHTWFLVALFILYLAAPLWKKLFEKRTLLTFLSLTVAAVLYCIPMKSGILCISDLHRDLFFFMVGMLMGSYSAEEIKGFMCKTKYIWLVLAAASSAIFLYWYTELSVLRIIPCLFILVAMFSFCCVPDKLSDKWVWLSKNSFGIYIMHWPVMMVVRTGLYSILKLNADVTVISMIAAGFIVPVLILLVLRRLPEGKLKNALHYLLGV